MCVKFHIASEVLNTVLWADISVYILDKNHISFTGLHNITFILLWEKMIDKSIITIIHASLKFVLPPPSWSPCRAAAWLPAACS